MKRVLFACLLGVGLLSIGHAQSYYYLPGAKNFVPVVQGNRGAAMGGAYIAAARGADAILTNPAGLGFAEWGELQLGFGSEVFGSEESDEDYYSDMGYDSYDQRIRFMPRVSRIGAAFPINLEGSANIAAGICYGKFLDFAGKSTVENRRSSVDTVGYYDDYIQYEERDYESTLKSTGGLKVIVPGFALIIDEKYSFGLSYAFALGGEWLRLGEIDEKYHNWGSDYGDYYDTTYTVNTDYEGEYDTQTNGILQLGATARPVEKISIGLVYTSGYTMDFEDGKEEWETNDSSNDYTLEDYDMEWPAVIGVGLAYHPSEEITLSAEFQSRPWSELEIDDDELDDDIEDGNSLRFGLEYDNQSLSLRTGYINETYPILDDDEDMVKLNTLTAGIGIATDAVGLDFGVGYTFAGWESSSQYDTNINLLSIGAGGTYYFDMGSFGE